MAYMEYINNPILGFHGEYRFLSNFYPSPIEVEGIVYPTVENAFQAHKTLDKHEHPRIAGMKPEDAKRAGRRLKLRPNWDIVKLDLMQQFTALKYKSNAALQLKLLATGNRDLVEVNTWGDTFWGVCDGDGSNVLGHTIMRVRSNILNNI